MILKDLLKELKYVDRMKAQGGKRFKKANDLLSKEATTDNIEQLMNEIATLKESK